MHSMRKYLAAFMLLLGTAGGSAHAASLSTDVSVNLGSVLSLSCFDEVDVNLSSDTYLAAISRNGSGNLPSVTRNARARSGQLNVNAGRRIWNRRRFRPRSSVNLDLGGVCAYRSLGIATGAQVRVERLEERLEANGGGFISVVRVRARDSEDQGPWRRRYNVRPNQLGAGVVRGIDVRLRLNMRNASEPGLYASPTDGTFRITVISNP